MRAGQLLREQVMMGEGQESEWEEVERDSCSTRESLGSEEPAGLGRSSFFRAVEQVKSKIQGLQANRLLN